MSLKDAGFIFTSLKHVLALFAWDWGFDITNDQWIDWVALPYTQENLFAYLFFFIAAFNTESNAMENAIL